MIITSSMKKLNSTFYRPRKVFLYPMLYRRKIKREMGFKPRIASRLARTENFQTDGVVDINKYSSGSLSLRCNAQVASRCSSVNK